MHGRVLAAWTAALVLVALPASAAAAGWTFLGTAGFGHSPVQSTDCAPFCTWHPATAPAAVALRDGSMVVAVGRYDSVSDTSRLWGHVLPAPPSIRFAGGPGLPLSAPVAGVEVFSDLQLASSASDEVLAVWRQKDANGEHVMNARLAPGSTAFSAPTAINNADNQIVAGPRLALGPAGDAVAVWSSTTGTTHTVQAAARPAAGTFGMPTTLDVSGDLVPKADVALTPSGAGIVAYTKGTIGAGQIFAKARTGPGSGFAPVAGLGAPGEDPDVDVATDGAAVVAFIDGGVVKAAARPAGGAFSVPQDVSGAGATTARLITTESGESVLAWIRGATAIEAARRPPGGSWSQLGAAVESTPAGIEHPEELALTDMPGGRVVLVALDPDSLAASKAIGRTLAPGAAGFDSTGLGIASSPTLGIRVVADQQGDAFVTWLSSGRSEGPEVAVFDAAAPTLAALTVPANAQPGQPVPFKATYNDLWSSPVVNWTIDGKAYTGEPSVAFTTAGTKHFSVSGLDELGNQSATSVGTVEVRDTIPPAWTRVVITNRTFAVAKGRTAVVATKAKRGTTFRLTVSEASKVTIAFEHPAPGRRVGAACVKQTAKNRSRKRCTRWVKAARSLTRSAKAGPNSVPFTGRIGKTALTPGSYRAAFLAVDRANNRSRVITVKFKTVR